MRTEGASAALAPLAAFEAALAQHRCRLVIFPPATPHLSSGTLQIGAKRNAPIAMALFAIPVVDSGLQEFRTDCPVRYTHRD
eukprot:scaffold306_cov241-Pinguiococcus_pyrenoidosus.AAC.6